MNGKDRAPFVLGALFALMWLVRVALTHRLTYGFLIWNLTLAAAPFALSFAVAALGRRRLALGAALAAWLLFLPNAPYVVTDFVHLRARAPVPLWYDAALLLTASLCGLAFGLASLRRVHAVVHEHVGRAAGWLVVAAACAGTGVGIWLGRFERHNSWDLLTNPVAVLGDLAAVARSPLAHPRALGVSCVFAALLATLYVADLTLSAGDARRTAPPPRPPTR